MGARSSLHLQGSPPVEACAVDFVMMGWIAVAGLGLAAALGAAAVALFPPLPRDLGGAPDDAAPA